MRTRMSGGVAGVPGAIRGPYADTAHLWLILDDQHAGTRVRDKRFRYRIFTKFCH